MLVLIVDLQRVAESGLDCWGTEEMLEMQGIPIFADALFACGVRPLFDRKVVSSAAIRKMAGNSFSQPCMTAFVSFALGHLIRKSESGAISEAPNSDRPHIIYNGTLDDDSHEDDFDDVDVMEPEDIE